MNNGISEKSKIKANNNTWYLLFTLYGEEIDFDNSFLDRNRITWNRYMAGTITDAQRASLIEKGLQTLEGLTPFSPEELSIIQKAFSKRHRQVGSTASKKLPTLDQIDESPEQIDFPYVEFDNAFLANSFFFPDNKANFMDAVFSGGAYFEKATFCGSAFFAGASFSMRADFKAVTFLSEAIFVGATFNYVFFMNAVFSDRASFMNTTFFGNADFEGATFSQSAEFTGATFSGSAFFEGATFSSFAHFEGVSFPHDADFVGVTFSSIAHFEGATFPNATIFMRATFNYAVFEDTTFSGNVDFRRATFGYANFKGATISDNADFRCVTFDNADFRGATFSGNADFTDATFSGNADFRGATFSGNADFTDATFSGNADFRGATFSGIVNFTGVTFSGIVDFEGVTFSDRTLFINVDMKGPTSFESATFSSFPPIFFGAKLHEGTVWRAVKWPILPKNPQEAGKFVDAYERLKLEMDRLKKHEDEIHFFALELQSRRILHGDWRPVSELTFFGSTISVPSLKIPAMPITPKPKVLFGRQFSLPEFTIQDRVITLHRPASGLPIAIYGLLSDYGRSYIRPFYWLLFTVAVGTLAFLPYFGLSRFKKAIGLSIANTLGVLGFRKDFVDPDIIEALPGSLKAFSAMQTVAGIVLLFLFGLAIRNRFRMK